MVSSAKLSDSEIDYYINNRYRNLCALLARAGEYISIETSTVSITAGTGAALPDHISLISVTAPNTEYADGRLQRILPWNASEVDRTNSTGPRHYWIERRHDGVWYLHVTPSTWRGDVTVRYMPEPITLTDDSDEIITHIGEEELVIIDVAIILRARQHSDTTGLRLEREEMMTRLADELGLLDISQAPVVDEGPQYNRRKLVY